MKHNQIRQVVFPILAALIWGTAFVAQDVCADTIGTFTFNAVRYFIAVLALLVLIAVLHATRKDRPQPTEAEKRAWRRQLWLGGFCCGTALAIASNFQQAGITAGTDAGKAGFLTALYVVLVPVFGLFFRRKVSLPVWIAVALSVVSLYLLCIKGSFRLAAGDRISFVASPGKVLVDADYSQIELRLLAHIADDETMIAAFRSGEDIHAVTASQVFGVPLDEVTPLQRSHAKAVNFGIVYGISAFSLAQDIGVFQSEAKAYMDSYFAKYHGVRDYMKRIVEQAKADGYVTTLFGRRRDLPELRSSNFNLRSFGERVALNMPIQGTAADIIKAAMVRVDARMRAEGLEAKLLLQVHDELIVECPAAEAETVRAILIEEMEHVVDYRVPLLVDAKIGASWAEAH